MPKVPKHNLIMWKLSFNNNCKQFYSVIFHRFLASSTPVLKMAITEATLREKLHKHLNIKHLNIVDESNCSCGLKFNVVIVSDDFEDKPLIQRHRMVNAILEEELKEIHAFSQKTLTTEQWEKSKN